MKKVAVVADATSAEFFFPFWHRYYASQFGAANLHVVTYAGMKPLFAGVELGNLWEVNAKYDDALRVGVIADLISALLRSHDVVLRCDVDEFLVPDPAAYANLAEFVEHNELPYVTARGVDVIEMEDDAPLDQDQPVFGVQRRFGVRSAALNKTCLTTVPLRWAPGFHAANVPPHFSGLYNLHMKFANIKSRIAWHERMLEGLEPGSKEYKYFAVGAEHLTGVQRFLAARPREGEESEAEFDKRFLDSVSLNPQNGIHQGEFLTQDFLIPLDGFALPENTGGNQHGLSPVSAEERLRIFERVARLHPVQGLPKRLLVAGDAPPANLDAAEAVLAPLGFALVTMANLTEEKIIALFAGAEALVILGHAGLAASRFCAPGTPVVAVSSSLEEGVVAYLASLDLRYDYMAGEQVSGGWLADPGRLALAITACLA